MAETPTSSLSPAPPFSQVDGNADSTPGQATFQNAESQGTVSSGPSFASKLMAGLSKAAQVLGSPEVRKSLLGLSIVGNQNSPGAEIAMQQINEIDRQQYQAAQLAAQARIQQSELETQALNRQRTQQEVSAFQTPEQKQAMELDTQGKLLKLHQNAEPPQLMPLTDSTGKISYVERKYNPSTGAWDTKPAMESTQEVVSSPDNPQVPYDPSQTITRTKLIPLTSTSPEVLKNNLELQRQISLATNPDVLAAQTKLAGSKAGAESAAKFPWESRLEQMKQQGDPVFAYDPQNKQTNRSSQQGRGAAERVYQRREGEPVGNRQSENGGHAIG